MSGQQVGSIVGFVIGAFVGYPQLGALIGGLIGGAIDPTKIEGPHIGDGRPQTSNEGEPIAWILGTPDWVQGNIVQISEVREVKKEDDGKGGPVQVTYQARQDYCIMAAESCEIRNSTIVGVLMVRVNGLIVYDMRPGSNMGAENAKFLEHHVFYYGHEDQMPNPTMEAISGVGNTPAYRGVFTMIGFDVDLTPYGNAIPTYEFILVGEGESNSDVETFYAAPKYGEFANGAFPLSSPITNYEYEGRRTLANGTEIVYAGESLGDVLNYFQEPTYFRAPSVYMGWSAAGNTLAANLPEGLRINTANDPIDPELLQRVTLVYNEFTPRDIYDVGANADACPIIPITATPGVYDQDFQGNLLQSFPPGEPHPELYAFQSCGSPDRVIYGIRPLYIIVRRKTAPLSVATGDPCILAQPVSLPGVPGYVIDCEGNTFKAPEYTYVTGGTFKVLRDEQQSTITVGGVNLTTYTQLMLGPVLESGSPDDNEAFWEAAYNNAVSIGEMPSGLVYPDDYPKNSTIAYRGEVTLDSLESDPISVADALERIAYRGDILPGDLDTTDINDNLLGYAIRSDYNAADCMRPLLTYSQSFGSEYDLQIHFHKYGGPIEINVDEQDFIEGSEATDEDTRQQSKEYPKRVTVFYPDPEQNYITRPQSASRNTPDIRAIGEETVQLAVVATADRAAQIAEIGLKVSWARAQGIRKFSVPWVGYDDYIKLAAGFPFAVGGQRRAANRLTIEDGRIYIEGDYDRQSAYTSNVTGVPAPPPTPPPSTIQGVTISAVMNIPALRDQDDRLGVYVSVNGILPSWQGCLLRISPDGGSTWQDFGSLTEGSVIGYLTEPLPDASPYGDDTTNNLQVSVKGGELNSITYQQFLNEGNPCAIVRPDGTAEIIQFRDADQDSNGDYVLSYLSRGRLGTETDEHPAGTRFVLLTSVYFIELPLAWLGKTLLFRPVTFGTSPESNGTTSLVFDPAWSQTELPPEFIQAEVDGSELNISWVPRHRFGTDANPVRSVNMIGYLLEAHDANSDFGSGNFANVETTSPQSPISIAGWLSPVTVRVRQVNRLTGPGIPTIEVFDI